MEKKFDSLRPTESLRYEKAQRLSGESRHLNNSIPVAASRQSAAVGKSEKNAAVCRRAATRASARVAAGKVSRTAPRNLSPADAEMDSPEQPRPDTANRADASPTLYAGDYPECRSN